MKWIYKEETINEQQYNARLNQLGSEGWEVYNQNEVLNEDNSKSFHVFLKKQANDEPQLLKS